MAGRSNLRMETTEKKPRKSLEAVLEVTHLNGRESRL